MTDRVVVGSSMAALVAADRLAAAGEKVRLLLSPGPQGGGFGSMMKDGRILELGVRFLELSYDGDAPSTPPLDSYRPGVAGHRPFARLIADYAQGLVGERLEQVRAPQMLFGAKTTDDLYFPTDPTVLRGLLDDATRQAIATEATAAERASGHPAGLLSPELADQLAKTPLDEASVANHGQTFHRLFMEPIAEKFLPGGCAQVMGTFRRKAWLPLFWPRTLAEAMGAGEVGFAPDRPLHTVRGGGAGEIVTALQERLAAASVQVESRGALSKLEPLTGGRTAMHFADGSVLEATRPVLGMAPAELFGAVGVRFRPAKARTVISWLEVADEDVNDLPSLLNIVDAGIPAVRISSGGVAAPGHRLLTVELRHDTPEAEIAEVAKKSIEQTSVLRLGAALTELKSVAVESFPLPSFDNAAQFAQAAAEYAERGVDAIVVGSAVGFGADALGEQVVQGHVAAAQLTS